MANMSVEARARPFMEAVAEAVGPLGPSQSRVALFLLERFWKAIPAQVWLVNSYFRHMHRLARVCRPEERLFSWPVGKRALRPALPPAMCADEALCETCVLDPIRDGVGAATRCVAGRLKLQEGTTTAVLQCAVHGAS